jgi:hypothetical protein
VIVAAAGRPQAWDLPLFLHVLGAMTLVGGMIAVAALALTGVRGPQHALLARATLWTSLAVVAPAWIVMRAAAQWIYSREGYKGHADPNWLRVGSAVSDAGLFVVLVTAGLSFWWSRRGGEGWQGRAVGVIGVAYLVALAFAWFVMAAKPGL